MTTPLPLSGRYALLAPIASGGMATVHLGRHTGPVGFARTVAIKRLHSHLCRSPDFVAMLLDEAHLAARIRHPNVVSPIDVVDDGGELFLVMEYVHGVSLSYLLREARAREERISPAVAARITADALRGLHAAHEARSERGEPLYLVHRDVSPPNILIGVDGVARMLDFGIAKARERHQVTKQGELKGKLSYMAPEQIEGQDATAASDVFSASVCLWESLTGERLFQGASDAELVERVLLGAIPCPSERAPELPGALDEVVMRGLARAPGDRFPTAAAMAEALEAALPLASPERVGREVGELARGVLVAREELLSSVEREGFSPVSMRSVLARLSSSPPPPPDGVPPLPLGHRDEITTIPDRLDTAPPPSPRRSPSSPGDPRRRQRRLAFALTCVLLLALLVLVHRRVGAARAARASTLSPAASAVGP